MARSLVVVGAGIGGLSAAIHARLSGLDVLVLDAQDRVGGKAAGYAVDGYRIDPGPSIVILQRIYEAVFAAAGRKMSDYLTFNRLDPISQVRMEGQESIDLPANVGHCLRILRSLDRQDAKSLERLLDTLRKVSPLIDRTVFAYPYDWPGQLLNPALIRTALPFDFRKNYKQLVDGWFRSPLMRAFFYGFPSYGGQSYNSKAIGALMIPFLLLEEGVWYPEGGVAAIPLAFERLAREIGVEIRCQAKVVAMETSGNRISSVRLESGEVIEADAFVCNVDRYTASQWLGRLNDAAPSYSYFTVHWGLRKNLVGLQHHTLLIPEDFEQGFKDLYENRQFPGSPIVYLNATSITDPSAAPSGCTNLFAVVTSPAKEASIDWPAVEGQYRERVVRTMARFGIDIQDSDLDLEIIQTPETFEQRDGSYKGSLYGLDEKHRLWGVFPARLRDEEYRNLVYCGGSVQPGAGLPMVILSGKFATEIISRQLR